MDSIPVSKQSGYCFYIVLSFTDDGSAGNLEVYCAPDNLAMGSTVYSRDLWDALQPYKMD